jgi:hypothetical protein
MDDNVMDPQENPNDTGHLPVSGEVGNGPVSYHDPVTQPTDDDINSEERSNSGTDDQPSPADGDAAGLS